MTSSDTGMEHEGEIPEDSKRSRISAGRNVKTFRGHMIRLGVILGRTMKGKQMRIVKNVKCQVQ